MKIPNCSCITYPLNRQPIRTYICICIYAYMYTCIHVYMYICIYVQHHHRYSSAHQHPSQAGAGLGGAQHLGDVHPLQVHRVAKREERRLRWHGARLAREVGERDGAERGGGELERRGGPRRPAMAVAGGFVRAAGAPPRALNEMGVGAPKYKRFSGARPVTNWGGKTKVEIAFLHTSF